MLIAAALTVYFTHQSMLKAQQELDDRALHAARLLAASAQYALVSGNHELLNQIAHQELSQTTLAYAGIFEAHGPLQAQNGELPQTPSRLLALLADHHAHLLDGVLYRAEPIKLPAVPDPDDFAGVANVPAIAASPLGHAMVGLSTQPIAAQKNVLLVSAGLLLLAALAATAVFVWRLSNRLTGQIQDVSNAVRRIAQGEFRVRVTEDTGGEVGQLERGINRMAQALYEHQTRLEERILEATAKLAEQKDQAERANIAKSKFFAAASHDLRQPLHALVLIVGALKDRIQSPELRSMVDHIEASVDAMEMLFNSLLDLSRLDAGVIEVHAEHFPVACLMERLKKQFVPLALEKGLTLRVHPCEWVVHSDPLLLERILLNLVTNAIRYTDHGGILLGCRRRGKTLLFQVWDSGQGIPEQQWDTVFQEFVQLSNPERDRSKGLGLGLAIVSRLSKLLDSPVTLKSRVGHGSVFAVQVPLGSAHLAGRARQPSVQTGALNIGLAVLIDDEDTILRAMEELFDSWKIDLVASKTPAEAMKVLDETALKPDVVISDYRLPGDTNGVNVVEAFRSRYGADLPAVILTGDTAPESIQTLNQAGLAVLHKPLRPARLRSLLTHLSQNGVDRT
ncbi:MAG TPA: hybrid sensor histidine kinase/response regulator [Thiobacillaceae bacterium]|nr:hybrid sensor histidine kinase/response regulator [Thiobacillaceae bacterium]